MAPELTTPELWVDEHGAYLYNYALAQVHDSQSAEDLVQETFLAALQSRQAFEGRSPIRTWLTGILKHKIIDHLRKKYRELPESTVTLPYEKEGLFRTEGDMRDHWRAEVGPQDWVINPADELERKEFWKILEGCTDRLPPRLRIVFTLREISELETEEICKDLEVTATNLWVMLHRARMQVRRCLELHLNA
ncbi:MAG: sigma-70 family RNA polymerase sigma factor [Ignavibacteriae bacterium]|nr:sigma-70 family RNA polymerase sigma factor [Ignavibacteriota bacterium]